MSETLDQIRSAFAKIEAIRQQIRPVDLIIILRSKLMEIQRQLQKQGIPASSDDPTSLNGIPLAIVETDDQATAMLISLSSNLRIRRVMIVRESHYEDVDLEQARQQMEEFQHPTFSDW